MKQKGTVMEKTRFVELLNQWDALKASGVSELQQMSEAYPWFQSLHLMLLKRMHMENHPSFGATLVRSAIAVPDRTLLYHLIYHDKGLQKPMSFKEPETTASVIDEAEEEVVRVEAVFEKEKLDEEVKEDLIGKFLQTEPRIVPKEGDFADAVAIAEKSNILYLDLVTETLADVYLKQGSKTKAIKIFEKLSLTIPEKSSYFAARIEELRKTSNRL